MKYVIYSALVGEYDNLRQPKLIARNFDYILFTNDISEQHVGVWTIRSIPYNNKDNTRVARWVKTHPHLLLPNYEYSLWVDSNMVIDDNLFFDRIESFISSQIILGCLDHNERWCVYDEALQLLFLRYDKASLILNEVCYLLQQKYPPKNGLIETNCILRKHHLPIIVKMNEDWWNMINRYSKRDQLSFNYVVWKNNIKITLILGEKTNSRNHPWLHCENHKKPDTKNDYIWKCLRNSYLNSITTLYSHLIKGNNNILYAQMLKYAILIITCYYVDYIQTKNRIMFWIKHSVFQLIKRLTSNL